MKKLCQPDEQWGAYARKYLSKKHGDDATEPLKDKEKANGTTEQPVEMKLLSSQDQNMNV